MIRKYGHPKVFEKFENAANLHEMKNKDYARGGRPFGNMERIAKTLALYPGFTVDNPANVGIVFMMKQLDAVLYMRSQKYEGEVENTSTRMDDITVYAPMISTMIEEENERKT